MTWLMEEECLHLERVTQLLKASFRALTQNVGHYEAEYKASMKYLWENRSDMDKMEIFSNERSVEQIVNSGEFTVKRQSVIEKLMESPYFARVDFKHDDDQEAEAYYIGRFSYSDGEGNMVIYDWRAPISSLYYDYEMGRACYKAPMGIMTGDLTGKRQYKIKAGVMVYALESAYSINDEILQMTLSDNSDHKMKNIVATIQREQNGIIRDESSDVLVIQGAAGSGKTSIALHRVAYFLYKYKEQLNAQNIMILSPNKVFADYVSTVLPELGEEAIVESGFEELARTLLESQVTFERFSNQHEDLLELGGESLLGERVQIKSSWEFLELLEGYLDWTTKNIFEARDIAFGGIVLEKSFFEGLYETLAHKPVLEKMEAMVTRSLKGLKAACPSGKKIPTRKAVEKQVRTLFKVSDTLSLYRDFFQFIGRPDLFLPPKNLQLEAADVYPYLYMKLYVEGRCKFEGIKHLVIDEMQDYTPVQYAVINKIFPCKKTILGDFGQRLNGCNIVSRSTFEKLYEQSQFVELTKSYRSTYEIMQFALRLQSHNVVPIERHGDVPKLLKTENQSLELDEIRKQIEVFKFGDYATLGIICKSQKKAKELFGILKQEQDVCLLDAESTRFWGGITVTSIQMAKGLEFDAVLIPFVHEEEYPHEHDGSLLYIACTRAMHSLTLTYHGKISEHLCWAA